MTAIGNENWVVLASYQYDKAGNRQQRALWNGVVTEYAPVDALNRSPWTRHMFNGTQIARFDYGFDDLNRIKYEQRDASADGFVYDKASEVTGFNRDGTLSSGVVTGGNLMSPEYDLAGNRSRVTSNGTTTNYSVNNLNEYTAVGSDAVESDVKGNVKTCNIKTYTQSNETWTYTYDAQNRLRVATGGGKTLEFWYDGKNRQLTRRINGDNNQITRSVWDGWDLLEERDVNDAPREYYLHGARTDELVLRWGGAQGDNWYGYDGRGNVSHLFAYIYNGLTIESYTYDLAGAPTFSGPNNQSLVENRFLFQGRDYLKEGAIYDYRNRFYHPGLGRFLQPDPIGFKGDAGNLYRYCGNDPVDRSDPMGLYLVVDKTNASNCFPGPDFGAPIGTVAGVDARGDIKRFEDFMNYEKRPGSDLVKWSVGVDEVWDPKYEFKNKRDIAVSDWRVISTARQEEGKTKFRNLLLVTIHWNMSASPGAINFARRSDGGEIEHFRDALRDAGRGHSDVHGHTTFSSARDIADRVASNLIGGQMSVEAAKSAMEGPLRNWAELSMQDSHAEWDKPFGPHQYKEP